MLQKRWALAPLAKPSSIETVVSRPSLLLAIVALTIFGKFVIWTCVVWLFRYPLRSALMVGLGLTQIGEFSYVLVQVARDSRLVGDDMYNATLAASVITILLNGILLRYLPRLLGEAPGEKLSSAQAR